jgi:hypothetical protein
VSPVPRHIRLLRDAFPALPIRVLYRGTGSVLYRGTGSSGYVLAKSSGAAAHSRTNPTVPDMVESAVVAGVVDVAAVRLA